MAITRIKDLRRASGLIFVAFMAAPMLAQQAPSPRDEEAVVYREPFTLTLKLPQGDDYQERFENRIPYVSKNDVYLFSGENFGLDLQLDGQTIISVAYDNNPKKANVWLTFSQPKELRKGFMMLVIKNDLNSDLHMEALMTVPGKKDIYETSIVPVPAGLSDFESWPHPIVQLVLRSFRLSVPALPKGSH